MFERDIAPVSVILHGALYGGRTTLVALNRWVANCETLHFSSNLSRIYEVGLVCFTIYFSLKSARR